MMKCFLFVLVVVSYVFAQDAELDEGKNSTTTSTTSTTTTSTSTTTTIAPTTTAPTTTTVAPSTNYYYNVTDHDTDIVCIMIDADIYFRVTYNIGENNTNTSVVWVPKPSDSVQVAGSCNDTDGTQFIEISWDEDMSSNSLKMVFALSNNGESWTIKNLSSSILLDAKHFPNTTEEGNLETDVYLQFMPPNVEVNHSYKCYSVMNYGNTSTTLMDKPYAYPVVMSIDGIRVQAFNRIPQYNKFVDEVHCDADKIADIVPIAIGCALAGLVIIVLIAYIVGRRRRTANYQSV